MKNLTTLMSAGLTACCLMFGGQGLAMTPDGETPAEETFCSENFTGKLYGLCTAYCEATDCGDEVAKASDKACQQLTKKIQAANPRGDILSCGRGMPPPPEPKVCPCMFDQFAALFNAFTGVDPDKWSAEAPSCEVLEVQLPSLLAIQANLSAKALYPFQTTGTFTSEIARLQADLRDTGSRKQCGWLYQQSFMSPEFPDADFAGTAVDTPIVIDLTDEEFEACKAILLGLDTENCIGPTN